MFSLLTADCLLLGLPFPPPWSLLPFILLHHGCHVRPLCRLLRFPCLYGKEKGQDSCDANSLQRVWSAPHPTLLLNTFTTLPPYTCVPIIFCRPVFDTELCSHLQLLCQWSLWWTGAS